MKAAALTLCFGRSGSGKSEYLYEKLRGHMLKGEKAFLIVPEQSTYEAEKALCRWGGLLGVEAVSFNRLCERVLSASEEKLPYLSAQGRQMILRKAALKKQRELTLFSRVADSRGFAQKMDNIIERCKQSAITPAALRAGAEKLPEGSLLRGKMTDVALLYGESESFLQDRYLTDADLWQKAAARLPGSFLEGAALYIDGIDIPSKQLFNLLEGLLLICASMTVTLRLNGEEPEGGLFSPEEATAQKLKDLSQRLNIPFYTRQCLYTEPGKAPALQELEKRLFFPEALPYTGDASAIFIRAAADRDRETEKLGDLILQEARRGVRFREMAVLSSDPESYGPRVRRVFARKGIPLFTDASKPLNGHAAAAMLLSALRYWENRSMEDVLVLVKSGFALCERAEGEIFENYVLRYGIYGSAIDAPFTFGEVPPEAEKVRAALYGPLQALHAALQQPTARQKAEALFAYMETLSLKEQLSEKGEALVREGRPNDGEVQSQVYNVLVALLKQIRDIWGEERLSNRDFLSLVEEGAGSYTLGVLPGTADQVLLGDFNRTRSPAVRELFVLGANEGLFPPAHTDDGLINDGELSLLQECGLELWNNTAMESRVDALEEYGALGKAKELLCFSFAYSNESQELAPSPLLKRLRALFPRLREDLSLETQGYPPEERGGFTKLLQQLALFRREGVIDPMLPAAYEYYRNSPLYKEKLQTLEALMDGGFSPSSFGSSLAAALYGKNPSMSASRLELFNRCPYSHFLKYGLRAQERKESGEKPADAGTFLHDALDAFLKRGEEKGADWDKISEEEALSLVDEVLPELIATHNDGIFLRDDRLREALFLRIESVKKCALSLVRQFQAGSFLPYKTELAFGKDSPFPPLRLNSKDGGTMLVYGRIDRVDVSKCGETPLYRIIDYKMGGKKFDPAAIEAGLSLQLPLYLAAASAALEGEPAGMYYMPLSLPAPKEGEEEKGHTLRGVTCDDEATLRATEGNLQGGSSIISQLRRNKDGSPGGVVCSREELNTLTKRALSKAEQTASQMARGYDPVAPYKDACKRCAYNTVCRFEEGVSGSAKKPEKLTLRQLLDRIEGEDFKQ